MTARGRGFVIMVWYGMVINSRTWHILLWYVLRVATPLSTSMVDLVTYTGLRYAERSRNYITNGCGFPMQN